MNLMDGFSCKQNLCNKHLPRVDMIVFVDGVRLPVVVVALTELNSVRIVDVVLGSQVVREAMKNNKPS